MTNRVLVSDVGGTNVRFAIAEVIDDAINVRDFQKLENDKYPRFYDALEAYRTETNLDTHGLPCVFAFAGPVSNDEVKLTNRDWSVSTNTLRDEFGLAPHKLINDFEAWARSVPEVPASDFLPIKRGTAFENAPVLVAGPGTGFGVASLIKTPSGYQVISTEGGHIEFAARNAFEYAVYDRLKESHGYVSVELMCSGSGMDAVYKAVCEVMGFEHKLLTPAQILKNADKGSEPELTFCQFRADAIMTAAGDLALANGTRGGVVLVGGVTNRIFRYLTTERAITRFQSRGPMSAYLENCPVKFLENPHAPLIGAAAFCLETQ